jgi:GxxExxY protein
MDAEHADRTRLNEVSEAIIGRAFTVLNTLGAGFFEKVYENALALELREAGFAVAQQYGATIRYKNTIVGEDFVDLLVNDAVLVELKTVKALDEIHRLQCVNYLKATGLHLCLLLNFGNPRNQTPGEPPVIPATRSACSASIRLHLRKTFPFADPREAGFAVAQQHGATVRYNDTAVGECFVGTTCSRHECSKATPPLGASSRRRVLRFARDDGGWATRRRRSDAPRYRGQSSRGSRRAGLVCGGGGGRSAPPRPPSRSCAAGGIGGRVTTGARRTGSAVVSGW